MKRYVLGSYALIAYFDGEEGAETVAGIFKDALADKAEVFLCVVNRGEMYYFALQEGGDDKAELYRSALVKYPITIIEANKELTIQAARYRGFIKSRMQIPLRLRWQN